MLVFLYTKSIILKYQITTNCYKAPINKIKINQQQNPKLFKMFKQDVQSSQTISFQLMRLKVQEKLLYVKTCITKKVTIEELFRFYPFGNVPDFALDIKDILGSKQKNNSSLNPQNEQKGIYVQDQNGWHLVECVQKIDTENNSKAKDKTSPKTVRWNEKGQIFNGIGISVFKNGRIFEGNYHDGKFCGHCLLIDEDGDLFIGHFKDGIKKSHGHYYSFHSKQLYKGQWLNNLPHGSGHITTQQSTYQGQFSNGLKNGFGIEKFTTGDYYAGEYINNLPQGYGEYYWTDGSFYKGDFSHGVRHGYGVWEDQNQSYYGAYRMDRKEGLGVYTWKGKKVYKGQFREDYREGYGESFRIGGVSGKMKLIFKGMWQKGTKNNDLQINSAAVADLYAFLEKENELLSQITLKKPKVGHKNCISSPPTAHKH